MKYFQVPQLQGIVKDYPRRAIPDNKCSDGRNIVFSNGVIRNRWGYGLLGQQLTDPSGEGTPVMGLAFYQRTRSDYVDIVAFTTTDTWKYNKSGTGRWELITYGFSGSADLTIDGTEVTIGSELDGASRLSGREIYVQLGTTDMNASGDWYRVSFDSVGSGETVFTISGYDGGDISSAVDYVLRVLWSGTADDQFTFSFPTDLDDTNIEKMLVVCNGVDDVQYWKGAGLMGSMVDFYNSTDDAALGTPLYTHVVPSKFIGNFGSSSFSLTLYANVYDNARQNKQTLYWSAAGYPYLLAPFHYDLIDTNDEVLGMLPLRTKMIIYKKYNLSEVSMATDPSEEAPFDVDENKVRNVGTPSINTVIDLGNFHLFLGWDDVIQFDGITIRRIGNDVIKTIIAGMNKEEMHKAFALHIDEENLYCLFLPMGDQQETPNRVYCFNYMENHWTIWEPGVDMTATGFFIKDESPTYGDMISDWGEATGATGSLISGITGDIDLDYVEAGMTVHGYASEDWTAKGVRLPGSGLVAKVTAVDSVAGTISIADSAGDPVSIDGTGSFYLRCGWAYQDLAQRYRDLITKSNFNSYLIGDVSGNIYQFDPDYLDDDGTPIESYIETSDFELNDPKHVFKLCEAVVGIKHQTSGYLRIKASVDFGENWSEWIEINMTGTVDLYDEYLVNFVERGTQVRFRIENADNSSNNYTPFEIESLTIGFNDTDGVRRK